MTWEIIELFDRNFVSHVLYNITDAMQIEVLNNSSRTLFEIIRGFLAWRNNIEF